MRCLQLLLLCVLIFCGSYAEADTISLVADEWCPYNCVPGSKNPGYLIEVTQAIFIAKGHTISYQVMPWARAIEDSRSGKFNGIVGAFKEDAPDFIYPEIGMGLSDYSIFVKAGNPWRYESFKSLDTISIGVIQDYSYNEELDGYIKTHSTDPEKVQITTGEDALQKNISKLLKGRIGAVVEDSKVISFYLKSNHLNGKIVPAGSLGAADVYVSFSPNNPHSKEYAQILSDGMRELKANGKFDKILAKYGL